jgi:hypothetical protein
MKLALAAVLPPCGDMLAAEGEYEGTTLEPALVGLGDGGGGETCLSVTTGSDTVFVGTAAFALAFALAFASVLAAVFSLNWVAGFEANIPTVFKLGFASALADFFPKACAGSFANPEADPFAGTLKTVSFKGTFWGAEDGDLEDFEADLACAFEGALDDNLSAGLAAVFTTGFSTGLPTGFAAGFAADRTTALLLGLGLLTILIKAFFAGARNTGLAGVLGLGFADDLTTGLTTVLATGFDFALDASFLSAGLATGFKTGFAADLETDLVSDLVLPELFVEVLLTNLDFLARVFIFCLLAAVGKAFGYLVRLLNPPNIYRFCDDPTVHTWRPIVTT